MKKVLIFTIAAITMWIILSSCRSYDVCPTYSNSSLKQYGAKYVTHAQVKVKTNKKDAKSKIW